MTNVSLGVASLCAGRQHHPRLYVRTHLTGGLWHAGSIMARLSAIEQRQNTSRTNRHTAGMHPTAGPWWWTQLSHDHTAVPKKLKYTSAQHAPDSWPMMARAAPSAASRTACKGNGQPHVKHLVLQGSRRSWSGSTDDRPDPSPNRAVRSMPTWLPSPKQTSSIGSWVGAIHTSTQ